MSRMAYDEAAFPWLLLIPTIAEACESSLCAETGLTEVAEVESEQKDMHIDDYRALTLQHALPPPALYVDAGTVCYTNMLTRLWY